jgi:hypothetical protein
MTVLRSFAGAVAWLLVALVVAIGAAGIVAGIGGTPGTPARAELTFAGDRVLRAEIHAATTLVADLAAAVGDLEEHGRLAFTRITDRDVDRAQATVDEGTTIADRVVGLVGQLRDRVAAMPGNEPLAALRYGEALRAQRTLVATAAGTAEGIQPLWVRFAGAAVSAERMATLLTLHDEQAGAAVKLATEARYADALEALGKSDATLAEIVGLHTQLARVADTTVLASWIDRHRDYDAALRTLYEAVVAANGRSSPEVIAASATERAMYRRLPQDTRALTVVMSEVAQGGLQQAAISIGEVGLRLDDILDDLDAGALP